MCGLIAYYKTSDRPLDPRLIEDMTHSLKHRGPDDYGFCFAGEDKPILWRNADNAPHPNGNGVAMGHRRLSIFDLTEAGRQPFVSPNKRLVFVFNGEIYNYVELREELSQFGFRFSTDCDTEVLLAAYEAWGPDCFNRLNGVWSVVIWDSRSKELVVARDRLGETPLFYTQIDGDWIFASEIKAFLKHPRITLEPNEQSLLQFISNGWAPIGTDTFFSGIEAVEPGTFLSFRGGNVTKHTYWDLTTVSLPTRSDEALAVEELDELLTDAVRLRLRGDLRVGAMLSGGLDSTSVISSIGTVLSSRPSEGRMIGDRLQAFTASFPNMAIDETDKVEELCRSIEIAAHKVFPCEQDNIEERLNEVARNMEAPFWNPAVIVHDALMRLARSSGTQVVLDGMGSDELFAGYDRHVSQAVRDSLHGGRVREAMENIVGTHKKHGRSVLKEVLRAILPKQWPDRLQASLDSLKGQKQDFDAGLFRNSLRSQTEKRSNVQGSTYLDGGLKRDLLRNNTPRWLHMGNLISMANSVVCRSPFLDFRLIEFAFSLDNNLKIRKGETKYILREAKRHQLPVSIVNDSRKIQFTGPGSYWFNGPLKSFALSLQDDKTSRISSFLHMEVPCKVISEFYQAKQSQERGSWRFLWRLASAESWLRAYF